MSQGFTADHDDVALPLNLTVAEEGVGGVAGLSPTVTLRIGRTTDTYLDFADDTFKTSGWTTKSAPLTEIGDGDYSRNLDLTALGGAGYDVGDTLIAHYAVDDGVDLVSVASDQILVSTSGERLKDIWRILGLDPSEPLIVSAVDRKSGTVITQSISVVANVATVTRTL